MSAKSKSVKMVKLSPDAKATLSYQRYERGVISAEECNQTLYALGFRIGAPTTKKD